MEFVWISGLHTGFPGGSDSKESACNGGDLGWGTFPGGGHGNLLQYSCLENLHGQRSLAGCSPWDCEESDMTEQLSTAQHRSYIKYSYHKIITIIQTEWEETLGEDGYFSALMISWVELFTCQSNLNKVFFICKKKNPLVDPKKSKKGTVHSHEFTVGGNSQVSASQTLCCLLPSLCTGGNTGIPADRSVYS